MTIDEHKEDLAPKELSQNPLNEEGLHVEPESKESKSNGAVEILIKLKIQK